MPHLYPKRLSQQIIKALRYNNATIGDLHKLSCGIDHSQGNSKDESAMELAVFEVLLFHFEEDQIRLKKTKRGDNKWWDIYINHEDVPGDTFEKQEKNWERMMNLHLKVIGKKVFHPDHFDI